MILPSHLGWPLSLKTPNMGITGLVLLESRVCQLAPPFQSCGPAGSIPDEDKEKCRPTFATLSGTTET